VQTNVPASDQEAPQNCRAQRSNDRPEHFEKTSHFSIITLVPAAGDGTRERHVEQTVLEERFIDVDSNHLADD
jgi:hypothetical protein